MRHSASQLISFLENTELQEALARYALSAADGAAGTTLFTAWEQSRNNVNLARGGEKGTTQQNISDREKFAAWLGIWWSIAKVRLRDQPAALAALGVELGNIRGKRSVATKTGASPVAPPA